jgi:hypothetical protein
LAADDIPAGIPSHSNGGFDGAHFAAVDRKFIFRN